MSRYVIKKEFRQAAGVYRGMIYRCNVPSDKRYKKYGAIGIKVCDRWMESFENFISDMGPRPSENYSLDRINGAGNYEPGNCRWATSLEQALNVRKKTRSWTFPYKGVSLDSEKRRNTIYRSYININKKRIELGRHHSAVLAALYYDKAAIETGLPYKRNFPSLLLEDINEILR